jgi:membrane protease YdiL (CAAX protease family)
MTFRERVADAGRFALRPTFVARPMAWGPAAALALLTLLAIDLALGQSALLLGDVLDSLVSVLPEPVEEDIAFAEDAFLSLLLAPVLEELLFRGWLSGKLAALRFALYGLAALALFMASLFAGPGAATALALAGVGTVVAGLVHWSRTRHRDREVPAWFSRNFGKFVWGSTLLFGLIHLGNYEPLTHPLGVLVVLPQTIGGLLLAYTRTRLGLVAAVAHHSAFNAVALALDYGW